MRKPNWKRLGLARPVTVADRKRERDRMAIENKIKSLPAELREFARNNPGLI